MTSITQPEKILLSYCGSWKIEWGPGSSRPDHFMLYMGDGDQDEYVGTFMTLSGALNEAMTWEGHMIACKGPIESMIVTWMIESRTTNQLAERQ